MDLALDGGQYSFKFPLTSEISSRKYTHIKYSLGSKGKPIGSRILSAEVDEQRN